MGNARGRRWHWNPAYALMVDLEPGRGKWKPQRGWLPAQITWPDWKQSRRRPGIFLRVVLCATIKLVKTEVAGRTDPTKAPR